MHFPLLAAMVMGLKQGINGIFNTLVASAIYNAHCFHLQRQDRLPSLRQLIFVTISLFVTVPALLFLFLDTRRTLDQDLARHQEITLRYLDAAQTGAAAWFDDLQGIVRFLAASSTDSPEHGRRDLTRMHASFNDFLRLGMTNAHGVTVAFSPTRDEKGLPTVGLDLSDRLFLKKWPQPPTGKTWNCSLGK